MVNLAGGPRGKGKWECLCNHRKLLGRLGTNPPSLRPSPMQLIVLPLPRVGICRIPYYRPNEFFCLNKTMAGSFSQCLDSKSLEKLESFHRDGKQNLLYSEIIRNEELQKIGSKTYPSWK